MLLLSIAGCSNTTAPTYLVVDQYLAKENPPLNQEWKIADTQKVQNIYGALLHLPIADPVRCRVYVLPQYYYSFFFYDSSNKSVRLLTAVYDGPAECNFIAIWQGASQSDTMTPSSYGDCRIDRV
jgi:hypothetical protein